MKRLNSVLRVKPEQKQYYMNKGYSVIDAAGEVIEQAMSTDVHELQNQVRILTKELEAKNTEIAQLVAKTTSTKKVTTKTKE